MIVQFNNIVIYMKTFQEKEKKLYELLDKLNNFDTSEMFKSFTIYILLILVLKFFAILNTSDFLALII